MSIIVCPICRNRFDSRQSVALPFCSERCRNIDLSRWLNEEYGLPVEPEVDAELSDEPDEPFEPEQEEPW